MNYIDLHCDALTTEGVSLVTKEALQSGGCILQCFAAFLRAGEGFSRAAELCDKFDAMCKKEGYVRADLVTQTAESGAAGAESGANSGSANGRIAALLTVEGGHALEGNIDHLFALYARGVRMMTLTWNFENELGFPNFAEGGRKAERRAPLPRDGARGLKPFGREAVEAMCAIGMIPDVSHGSDRLLFDVAEICKRRGKPFVASHSGAAEIFPHPRNLTDGGIRLIAESGGAVGIDFCVGFTSSAPTAEGQRAALLAHAAHILDVGGEDVLAIGSDFDGTPPNPCIGSPADMPAFLEALVTKFGERIAEKIAFRNALRVLNGVLA